MRRVQKILAGIFLSGVLIGGVGTGIAMVEYSSLTYGGEKLIGGDSLVTKSLDYNFEPDRGTLEVGDLRYWGRGQTQEIEVDNSVPAGTVRFEVTYNERAISPKLVFTPYEEEEERTPKKLGYLHLTASYHDNEFALFMENKDGILEELKQRKISSYKMAYITDVKIKVNAATVPYIDSCYIIQ